jgi:hypothetical protein
VCGCGSASLCKRIKGHSHTLLVCGWCVERPAVTRMGDHWIPDAGLWVGRKLRWGIHPLPDLWPAGFLVGSTSPRQGALGGDCPIQFWYRAWVEHTARATPRRYSVLASPTLSHLCWLLPVMRERRESWRTARHHATSCFLFIAPELWNNHFPPSTQTHQ